MVPERKTAELERRKVPVSQQWETTEGPIAPSGAPVPLSLLRTGEIPGAELKAFVLKAGNEKERQCQNVVA